MLYWNPYTLDISIDSGDIRNIIIPSYRVGGYIDVARSLQFDFMWHYLNFLIFFASGNVMRSVIFHETTYHKLWM